MELNLENTVAVAIESFLQGIKTDVDVYIKVADKFLLLTRAGDFFDLEQLKRFQVKNLTHLYIKKEDYQSFIKRQLLIAGIVIEHDNISSKRKTEVLTHAAENVFKEIDTMGFNITTYQSAKQITNHIATFIETQDRLSRIFEGLNAVSDELVKHSIATGLVATMIGKGMGWTRKDTIEKLNLGGFLHDIGKKELEPELLKKPRAEMTRDEVREYETHPYRGMLILNSLQIIPQDIVSIAYEHHENCLGLGYPRRLRDPVLHPLAKVVGLANIFVNLTIKSLMNPIPVTAEDSLTYIEVTMGLPYGKEPMEALKNLIEKEKKKKSA